MWQTISQNLQSASQTLGNALSFAPPWTAPLLLIVAATIAVLLLHAAILAVLRRLFRGRRPYLQSVLDATRNPTRFGLLLIALAVTLPIAPLGADTTGTLIHVLAVATICLLGWIALAVLRVGSAIYLMRFRLDVADNLLARKHVTQVHVLLRVLDTVIVLITAGFALMTFETVRQYGLSLFASAGVAGIIAGLAARPVLSNLLAGVQLAVTQPIRLEDAVTVENEYGSIEEINSTYVVIRLWDLRRLIVPLSYFIEKPFYNWTRQATSTIGSVLLYVDYTAPVERIRQKAAEIVAQAKQWNGKVTNVQVTNTSPEAIEVRVLVNSNSAAATSNLCADLREQLIAFLQQEHPEALPRRRNQIIALSVKKEESPPAPPAASMPPGR